MRSFLLATTLGAAQSLAVANKSKKPAVQALLESATTMLKNGVTPAVVDFADETLAEVSGVVIPAILDESANDQAFVYSLHSRFQVILDRLSEGNEEVYQLNQEEQAKSVSHKSCRSTEAEECQDKRECEMQMYRLWTLWVTCEEELREIHGYISGHFCPPDSNGTLHAFRVASVPWMQQYMVKKEECGVAETTYDDARPHCVTQHSELDQRSSTCNQHQTDLEEKACAHALRINEVLATYYNAYAQSEGAYNCAVQEIMELERDRKREWVTLQVVNCLLVRIREQNGAPCDTASGGVTAEVGVCEAAHGINVCTSNASSLCLEYPLVPPHPPNCAARDQVDGECLPVVQATPCCSVWHAQEYDDLPAVPLPPFSATNPGCNAYPECDGCNVGPSPTPITMDTCPGYTVDGCVGNDAEVGEHPLTFVRSVEGVADVRCCSIDGDTCASENFAGGVQFVSDGGHTYEGCYFDVTYQVAMTVCHNAGKRICTNDEMQQSVEENPCCNTGCWHNHHAIWVDVAGNFSVHEAQDGEARYVAADAAQDISDYEARVAVAHEEVEYRSEAADFGTESAGLED